MLRKINGVLTIITSAVLLVHIVIMSLLLSSIITFQSWFSIIGHCTLILFTIHALLSIIIIFFCSENGFFIRYASFNIRTIFQRLSAILMIILFHFHSGHYTKVASDGSVLMVSPTILIFLLEVLLEIVVMVHISISLPKALITLGITRSDTSIRRTMRICDIAGVVVTVCSIVALCIYCF